MRQLYLTFAEVRRLYGSEHYTSPSRFLAEIPPELVQEVRSKVVMNTSSAPLVPAWEASEALSEAQVATAPLRLGGRVRHAKFGEGVVLTIEGRGEHARVQVNFQGAGAKWLVAAYANLQLI